MEPKIIQWVCKGQLVVVTTDLYSDYGIEYLSKALRDFDMTAVVDIFLTRYPERRLKYKFGSQFFSSWLMSEGYLEKVPCLELHSYGDAVINLGGV